MSICCRLTQLKGTQRKRGREGGKVKTRTTNYENIPYQVLCISSRKPGDNQRADKRDRRMGREGQTGRQKQSERDRDIQTDGDRLSRWERDIKWHCPKTQRTKPKRTRTQTRMRCRDPQKPQCQWGHNKGGEGRLIAVYLDEGGKGEVLRIVLTKH